MTEKQKKTREILQQIQRCCVALRTPVVKDSVRKERAQQLRVHAKIILALPVEDLDIFKDQKGK